MKSTGKYIGINQRIPFDVLDAALYRFLDNETIDKTLILTHLKEFTKGENRALKATSYAVQTLYRQKKYLLELKKVIDCNAYLKLPESDRKAIILCLLCLTFPLAYDLLFALASGFKVQPQLNRQFINQKMATLYGSNRTLDIALDALIPMIIELATVERVKIGIYKLRQKSILTHPFITEFVIYTDIKLSGSKSILIDDLQSRPWYMFFDINLNENHKYTLFKYSDSRSRQGYLRIN